MVEGKGFIEFANACVSIDQGLEPGQKYDIRGLMPTANMAKSRMTALASKQRAAISVEGRKSASVIGGGMSCDGWSDASGGKKFVDATMHNLRIVPAKEGEAREHFDLDTVLVKRTLVTDNASNMPRIVGASVSEAVAPLDMKWGGLQYTPRKQCSQKRI